MSRFQPHRNWPNRWAILTGGFAAGLLDIVFAIARNGMLGIPAKTVLQSVASGIAGSAAFRGGTTMAVMGLMLHFAMTIAMAAIFVAIAERLESVRRHWVAAGFLFGAGIYIVMNYIVVPHSKSPPGSIPFSGWVLAAHLLLVGIPISLAARNIGSPTHRIISRHL